MKRPVLLAVVIAALAIAMPASADPITLTFGFAGVPYGSPGWLNNGSVFIGGPTWAGGSVAVDTLVISGDGIYDGSYAVTGGLNSHGALSFSTSPGSQFVTIVGGVPDFGIVNGTTLLTGTGGPNGFSDLLVSSATCPAGYVGQSCFSVKFTTPDAKDEGLLSAIGLAGTQWQLATFDVVAGTGNNFPAYSSNAVNTAVPEPSTMTLLGLGLAGVVRAARRRKK